MPQSATGAKLQEDQLRCHHISAIVPSFSAPQKKTQYEHIWTGSNGRWEVQKSEISGSKKQSV